MTDLPPQSSALDEEIARAEVYGLLAQLWYAAPGPDLLASLRAAATDAPAQGAFLEEPWRAVVGAARALGDDEIAREFDALFGGIGKPEVYLYGSHYLTGFLNERPLAKLRTELAELGLARGDAMSETEDHVAYLCEVMRYLIAGDDARGPREALLLGVPLAVANLTRQREFFAAHLQPWLNDMCDAVAANPGAQFYAALAAFTRAFASVEAQGFDMLA